MSVAINLLMLALPLYMLQIFDRVLSGRSLETLVMLTLAVFFALGVMGSLDACRTVMLARFGDWLERRLSRPLMLASVALSARPSATATAQPMNDLGAVRQFLGSPGVTALFDAPLMPLFIAVIWLIHPLLGVVALGAALLLGLLALASDLLSRRSARAAASTAAESETMRDGALTQAPLLRTMGLAQGVADRWSGMRDATSTHVLSAGTTLGVLSVTSRTVRFGVQAAILGGGAYLVLDRAITPGQMIAASIILGRALSPVEIAIGSWRQFVASRQAWRRIVGLLTQHAAEPDGLDLPAPEGRLSVDRVTLTGAPDSEPLLRNISLDIPAGATLGIIGASGSGKSSLGRLIAGAWRPSAGVIRLDGADLRDWRPEALGPHLGYLPQTADLLPGTVRENIARFGPHTLDGVITAARRAHAHDVISAIPGGYEAQVGTGGSRLSGGQRQHVALARALYGAPKIIILDEPDTNLDQAGHAALLKVLDELRAQSVTLVIIAHRMAVLGQCDWLAMLEAGQIKAFGPAQSVAKKLGLGTKGQPLRAVSGQGSER